MEEPPLLLHEFCVLGPPIGFDVISDFRLAYMTLLVSDKSRSLALRDFLILLYRLVARQHSLLWGNQDWKTRTGRLISTGLDWCAINAVSTSLATLVYSFHRQIVRLGARLNAARRAIREPRVIMTATRDWQTAANVASQLHQLIQVCILYYTALLL